MRKFETFDLTRREALKASVAAVAAAGGLLGPMRGAYADDTLAEVKKRGELVVATEMQFPPFDISDNGVYKGVDRELVDAVAKELGVKVSYLDLPWTSVLPGLEAKKFDLCIAPVTITKERMKRYLFTVPIADATAALMKRGRRQEHRQAGRHRRQDGRRTEGHFAARTAQGLRCQTAQARRDQGIRRQQPVLRRSGGRAHRRLGQFAAQPRLCRGAALGRLRRGAAARSASRPISPGSARLDDATLIDAINAAIVKTEGDGTMATIQKKWFGQTMDLPKTVPQPAI